MITHLTRISAPVHTHDTVETGTVLPGFGKLKPIPIPMHTRDPLSWVYLYLCHALTAGLGGDTSWPHLWVIFFFNLKSINDITYRECTYNHSVTNDSNTTTNDSDDVEWYQPSSSTSMGKGLSDNQWARATVRVTQGMTRHWRQGTAPPKIVLTYPDPHSHVFIQGIYFVE